MIELPDKKKCYNLPEQVAQNLRNITFLAEQYKNIDALPAIWKVYKEEFDSEMETFEGWTTTFEGWNNTLSTYLANMSSAAVSAIAGQTIAPAVVNATTSINAPSVTGNSIVETMTGYAFTAGSPSNYDLEIVYDGIVKNGNKLTLALAINLTKRSGALNYGVGLGVFSIPNTVGTKLYPTLISGVNFLDVKELCAWSDYATNVKVVLGVKKPDNVRIFLELQSAGNMVQDTKYYIRTEVTFLLSDPL